MQRQQAVVLDRLDDHRVPDWLLGGVGSRRAVADRQLETDLLGERVQPVLVDDLRGGLPRLEGQSVRAREPFVVLREDGQCVVRGREHRPSRPPRRVVLEELDQRLGTLGKLAQVVTLGHPA